MLIKCPECNKEISDKSQCCIYCGFPLNKRDMVNKNICIVNNKEVDLSDLLPQIIKNDNKAQVLIQIRQKCDLQLNDAMSLYNIILQDKKIPEEYNSKVDVQSLNKPHCPTCNSTNIQKISGTKRFVTTGLFGLASSNIGKTMECKNCGAKW